MQHGRENQWEDDCVRLIGASGCMLFVGAASLLVAPHPLSNAWAECALTWAIVGDVAASIPLALMIVEARICHRPSKWLPAAMMMALAAIAMMVTILGLM